MEKELRELKVTAIENGTVIDHIPAQNLFQVVRILGLENYDDMVLYGTNLESKKYGRKGLIKVSNKFFKSEEINKIALAAPSATLIIIKDFKVVEKKQVEIPSEVVKFVKCFNPNCITNHQKIETRFNVISKNELKLQCHYCEKITAKNNIEFI
jgi:aspartate carbamoyltransferase regulatory subunit